MSDDSYFDDDFVLDDSLIAVLDAEEERFQTTQAPPTKRGPARSNPPPPKKQKTHHNQPSGSVDEYGDLPEISIQGDGTYGVAAVAGSSKLVNANSNDRPAIPSSRAPVKPVSAGPSASTSASVRRQQNPSRVVSEQHGAQRTQLPAPTSSGSTSHKPPPLQPPPKPRSSNAQQAYHVPSQGRVEQRTDLSELRDRVDNPRPPSRRTSGGESSVQKGLGNAVSTSSNTMGGYPVSQRFAASQSRSTMDVQEKAEQTLRTELNILRTQMEELNRKQTEDQAALKQARDARFAKDGEVSILRNNIEKINQQHATELAKLTAAKEIAESMQAQLRQQMREEIDRVKTQYAFRQHEMEAAVRRTPLALRGSKINGQSTISSPTASSQMRQWNAGPSAITQTPRKPRFAPDSPKAQRIRNVAHEKFVGLPGFQSGFDSTPLKNKGKGKERARELPADDVFLRPAPVSMSPPSSPPRAPADSRGSGDVAMVDAVPFPSADLQKPPGLSIPPASNQNADVEMSDTEKTKGESIQESLTVVEPPDWKEELQHIIFTHHPRSRPSQLTFHLAINTSIPASDLDQTVVFTASSRRLLEALGASSSLIDWNAHLSVISNSLISMAHALALSNSIIALTALLGLIRTLAYSIPSFTASLLSLSSVAEDGSPEVMTTLRDIVKLHLNPAKKHLSVEESIDIGSEVTNLLETLCWSAPDYLVPNLAAMLSDHDVLMMMISPAQPTKTLVQVTRALAFLASQPTLYKHFLFAPRDVDANPGEDEFHWTPQIEQLAAYLIRDGPEVLELQENVLAFIATLSTAHPDALTIVSGSNTLIPGMIVFLSNISSPLWEDDDDLMASPERVTTLVRLIVRTMTLLYYMICSRSPKYNLARRLQIAKHHVAHRTFNTLDHAFMVTFGRFSFADAPEWIDDAGKAHLEGLSGMARQVLELVVDGPELELIWGSFQPDPEGSKKAPIDLEEDEEMLMDQVIDS